MTFFALAAYLTIDSIPDLTIQAQPRQSIPGLAVTAAALIVMPALAIAKHRTGQQLGDRTWSPTPPRPPSALSPPPPRSLAWASIPGLGWWWADPAAALIIAALAVKEGIECWEIVSRSGTKRNGEIEVLVYPRRHR